MIWTTILAAATLGQKSLFPANAPYHSRAEFYDLTSKIRPRMSKEDVIKILGKPDRVRKSRGDWIKEIVEYGIDPHSNAATLGVFVFGFGKFEHGSTSRVNEDYFNPLQPYRQLIPESELRPIIGALNEDLPYWLTDDPLRTIRLANLFIKLGDEKAKFALGEYERFDDISTSYQWHRTLLKVLFTGLDIVPNLPSKDRQDSGAAAGGDASGCVRFYEMNSIRTRPIRPPDDPFGPLVAALKAKTPPKDSTELWPYIEDLLMLVRGVTQPVDLRWFDRNSKPNLAMYHELFLKGSPRWDVDSQSYMRADGKILPDLPDLPLYEWNIPGLANGTEMKISLLRVMETGDVAISFDMLAIGGKRLPNVTVRAIDASRNIELGSWQTKDGTVTGTGERSLHGGGASEEGSEFRVAYEVHVLRDTKIQLEVVTPSGTTRSSIVRL